MVNLANPILLIVIPLLFVFLIAFSSAFSKSAAKYLPIIAFGINVVVAMLLVPEVLKNGLVLSTTAGFKPPIAIDMIVDKLALFLVIIASVLGFVVSIYNVAYIDEEPEEKFYALFTLLITGIIWMIITGDLFNLFVAFEVTSIAAFGLVGFHRDKGSVEAGFKYLVMGAIGGSLLLVGIIMLYAATGTLNIIDVAQKSAELTFQQKFLAYALIFVGLGIEGALFPLNAWLPDAHPAAPSSVSSILSGIMTTAAIYAIIRITNIIFDYNQIYLFLMFFALLTLIFGEIAAYYQKDIKRMLAYSTIGQTGLFFFAFTIHSTNGLQGAFLQIINHSVSKSMLFLVVGAMIVQVGSRNIEDFVGLGRKMKVSSFFLAIGMFSLMGMPPFFGFWSKLKIIFAALQHSNALMIGSVVIILLMSVVEGAYFFKLLQMMFFGKAEQDREIKEASFGMLVPVVILGFILLFISFYPTPVLDFAHQAASDLMNKNYINLALKLGGL